MKLLLIFFMFGFFGRAEFENMESMNDLSLSDFADFPEKWHPVTVRYRKDNNEMRFVYANELAFRALQAGTVDFPEGSVFGKIGRVTEEDPSFPSSLVPSGAKRFQFMVRDKVKFKSLDGWGYALFNEQGRTFPGEPAAASQACAACHRLVAAKGFVFSELMDSFPSRPVAETPKFKNVAKTSLPIEVRRWLTSTDTNVHAITGELTKNVFQGTLDEVVPLLTKNTLKNKSPSLLMDTAGKRFSMVIFDKTSRLCGDRQALMSIRAAPEMPAKIVKRAFCE